VWHFSLCFAADSISNFTVGGWGYPSFILSTSHCKLFYCISLLLELEKSRMVEYVHNYVTKSESSVILLLNVDICLLMFTYGICRHEMQTELRLIHVWNKQCPKRLIVKLMNLLETMFSPYT